MIERRDESADFPANPADKAGYAMVFADEFDAGTLDGSKWLPFHLPQWSSRERAAAHYDLRDGRLLLLIEEDQRPWCPEQDGATRVSSLQTGCFSGPLGSAVGQHRFKAGLRVAEAQPAVRLFTPRYGYFETRLKAAPAAGYMGALWMIGFEEEPEQSAEICVCEIFGGKITSEESQINFGLHPFADPDIEDEFYRETMKLNAARFHVYAAEWTPSHVDFFVDNVMVRRAAQSPGYAMQLMLGFYEIPDLLKEEPGGGAWPKALEVDYVRVFEPLKGYA